MDNYQFERRLVEIFAELIESKGLRHEPTAELAWPDKKDAGPAWQKIRNRVPPQKLSVLDAFGMAQALGLSMSALCGIVEGRAIEESMRKQAAEQLEKKEAPEDQKANQGRPAHAAGLERAKQNNAMDSLPGAGQSL